MARNARSLEAHNTVAEVQGNAMQQQKNGSRPTKPLCHRKRALARRERRAAFEPLEQRLALSGTTGLDDGPLEALGAAQDAAANFVQITDTVTIEPGTPGGPARAGSRGFGQSLAVLGDLDQDGITDVAVGSPLPRAVARWGAGAVYVLFMNADGTAKDSKQIGDGIGGGPILPGRAGFGHALATMGDLDGNGVTDLAVSAPYETDHGAIHVLRLNRDGSVKSSTRITSGENGAPELDKHDRFGRWMTAIGDLDRDGVTDLAVSVGASVYVLMMRRDATVKRFTRIESDGWVSVGSIGDLDRDGNVDLAIGRKWDNTGARGTGAIDILFMNDNGSVRSSRTIANGTGGGPTLRDGDQFGSAVSAAGDVDRDGVIDLVVGATGDDFRPVADGVGAVYILFMNRDGTARDYQKIGNAIGGGPPLAHNFRFGTAMTSFGDLDGNGDVDLMVGATGEVTGVSNDRLPRGAVYTLQLSSDGTVQQWQKIASDTAGGPSLGGFGWYGSSLTNLGDLDADGVTDFAVGDMEDPTTWDHGGAVSVMFMNTDGTVKRSQKISRTIAGGPPIDDHELRFGQSIAALGDLNGDGVGDLAVGAPGYWWSPSISAVYILLMNSDGTVAKRQKIGKESNVAGLSEEDFYYFGWTMSSLGDLDGDGVADLAVGARNELYVLFLHSDGTVKRVHEVDRSGTGIRGRSVAGLGDVDGDGIPDMAVSQSGEWIRVLFMNSDGTVRASQTIASGLVRYLNVVVEKSIAAVGDLDGNGVNDLAIGAGEDYGSKRGAVELLFLDRDGTVEYSFRIDAETEGVPTLDHRSFFGWSVTSLGDMKGDQGVELVVGTPGDEAVHIFSLAPIEPPLLPTVSLAVENSEIHEAGGMATITATLSETISADVIVHLLFSGTATNGKDYTTTAQQIRIAAGETSGFATITATDDDSDEGDEAILVEVIGVTGAAENDEQQATITVLNDDGPVNQLSIPRDLTALPGDTIVVPVHITTADLPADGRLAVASFALEYDPSALTAASVAPGSLMTANPGWTMRRNLGTRGRIAVAGATSLPVAGVTADVLANVTFVVSETAVAGRTLLNLAASAGGVFTELSDQNADVLILALPVTNDEDPVDGLITIELPTVTLSVDNSEIDEAVGIATVTATLSEAANTDVMIDLGFSGTADNGSDYRATAHQVSIAAGDLSGSVVLSATDDDEDEGDETIVVDVVGVTGAEENGQQQVTTILLNDDGLVTQLSVPRDLAAVPGEMIVVPVRIATADLPAGGRLASVAVGLAYDRNLLTAVSVAPGSLMIDNAGWTLVDNLQTLGQVRLVGFTSRPMAGVTNDVIANVSFVVSETAPQGPTPLNVFASSGGFFTELLDEDDNLLDLGGLVTDGEDPGDGVITIGRPVPTVSLSIDAHEIEEAGGAATVTATLSAAADTDVTVDLAVTGTATAGRDYVASARQIQISAGDASGSLTLTATDDADDEGDETIIVDLLEVVGARESNEQQVTTTILDDDGPVNQLSIPRDLAAAPGETIVVPIHITTADLQLGDRLVGVSFALAYDQNVLTATSVDPGGLVSHNTGWSMVENLGTLGRVVAVGFTSVPLAGVTNNVFAHVTFHVNEAAPAGPALLNLIAASDGALTELVNEVDNQLGLAEPVTNDEDSADGLITIAPKNERLNRPPVLDDPGTQIIPETRRTLAVTLVATDPDLEDPLTYAAEVESAEYYLDRTLNLNLHVELYEDFGGLGEKWLLGGNNRTWYYLTPDGNFYRWNGGNVLNRELVASLSPATHGDPSLLYDARAGQPVAVAATLDNNVLTLAPQPDAAGAFSVTVTVSDGKHTDSKHVLIVLQPNEGPTLADPGRQTMPTTRSALKVPLYSTDSTNDPLTVSASLESAEYYLDQTIGFSLPPGGLSPNWSGAVDERWLLGDDGETWFFLTRDGNLWRWLGGDRNILANAELVASLSPATHADPSLLYDAHEGGTAPVTLSVAGNMLTIDPDAGFVGSFSVLVTATDTGGASDSKLVRVDVTPTHSAKGFVDFRVEDKDLDFARNESLLNSSAIHAVSEFEPPFVSAFDSKRTLGQDAGIRQADSIATLVSLALDDLWKEGLLYEDAADSLTVEIG